MRRPNMRRQQLQVTQLKLVNSWPTAGGGGYFAPAGITSEKLYQLSQDKIYDKNVNDFRAFGDPKYPTGLKVIQILWEDHKIGRDSPDSVLGWLSNLSSGN